MKLHKYTCYFLKTVCVIVLLLFFPSQSSPNELVSEEKIKALFIKNLINYVSWPAFRNAEKIKTCVMGNDTMIVHFEKKETEIKYKNSYLEDCHVLYIGASFQGNASQIIYKASKRPILTISDNKDFVKLGGILEFNIKNTNVVLKVNPDSLKNSDLEISPELLNMMETFK